MSKCHPCHPPVPTWPPDPRAGRGPADPGKGMVGKVLIGNGITAYSDGERDALIELCSQRLDAFREQRGEEVFAHRSRHRAPISDSVKYRVLTDAPGPVASAAEPMNTKGPWRWTTSSRRTRAALTTSATCRPSASAATPAHSKAQAVDQLFDRAAQLAGHVLENLPQGADP